MKFHGLSVVQDFTWKKPNHQRPKWMNNNKKMIPDEYSALDFLLGGVLSKELAWASEMIDTVTTGGDIWTFNLVPTNSLTVAENLVLVFRTCGGCFSMTNELLTKESKSIVKPSLSSGKMFMVNSWLGMLSCSWIISNWRICCMLIQMISAKSSHHFWMVSRLLVKGAPFPVKKHKNHKKVSKDYKMSIGNTKKI